MPCQHRSIVKCHEKDFFLLPSLSKQNPLLMLVLLHSTYIISLLLASG
jgi:hypothetical protein